MAIGIGFSPVSSTTSATIQSNSSAMASSSADSAGQLTERCLQEDRNVVQVHDQLRCSPGCPSVSGLRDSDYPNLKDFAATMRSVHHISGVTTIPLPASLVEQFNHMQQNCDMGLFPEIGRAWLTIDSNIILWAYDNAQDIAFYDRLTETIVAVGLVSPKSGVFKDHITHIMCLATTIEIQLLGVMAPVTGPAGDASDLRIVLEPLFSLPTDNVTMAVIAGTESGRIFLGGRDGCLYEVTYRSDEGWFSSRSRKINHSRSSLSTFIPTFLTLSAEDAIVQIEVDDSRHLLYTRSDSGTIELYDLGADGQQLTKVASLSAGAILQQATGFARTVDQSNFRSIVQICAIRESESLLINLLAVTEAGVRLYFTASKNMFDQRPSALQILHIRLPPGFSASSGYQKPARVHLCHHRRGATIMLSPQSQESDMLWLLTNDPFPFASDLMEISAAVQLNSRVWKMVEESKPTVVTQLDSFLVPNSSKAVFLEPPLLVTQDLEPQRKFVFLASDGIHVVYKPRPVDHLRQVLIDNQGFDNDAVRGFFVLYGELQAAVMALSLACAGESPQVSEWATLSFFKYARDAESRSVPSVTSYQTPVHSHVPHTSSTASPFATPSFSPSAASPAIQTPANVSSGTFVDLSEYSVRHNALYKFFSRIIRPVWFHGVVIVEGRNQSEEFYSSSVSVQELAVYITKLKNLQEFMRQNLQLPNPRNYAQSGSVNQISPQVREKLSLSSLSTLITNCKEVLELWKILHEHNFQSTIALAPPEIKQSLKAATFRDLILTGVETTARLASCLVQRFIVDNETTDAISHRLSLACPSIFKHENALYAKAHEKLTKARTTSDLIEREKLIAEGSQTLKSVGARINLRQACQLLQAVNSYKNIIDLCVSTATLRDPQNVASHFYRNGEPESDLSGSQAFMTRMECYQILLECFQALRDHSQLTIHPSSRSPGATHTSSSTSTSSSSSTWIMDMSREEAARFADSVLSEAMTSKEELLHVAVYDWLYAHQEYDRLLLIKSAFLENYLKRKTAKCAESTALMDLLWMFYERNGHFRAAAEILCKLAERHSSDMDLSKRREYLSRAIVCMKSQSTMTLPDKENRSAGGFLHELEEKMEVTRLQMQLLDSLRHKSDAGDLVSRLNSDLLDITNLYDIAESRDLPEMQLAIVYAANHYDQILIETFWAKIIDKELQTPDHQSGESIRRILENKITSLAQMCMPSERFFPIPFLIRHLESNSDKLGTERTWLVDLLVRLGYPVPQLVEQYHRLLKAKGAKYTWPGKEVHLLDLIRHLMEKVATNPNTIPRNERFVLIDMFEHLSHLFLPHSATDVVWHPAGWTLHPVTCWTCSRWM
jgi:nuclear pore complex protein Nup155